MGKLIRLTFEEEGRFVEEEGRIWYEGKNRREAVAGLDLGRLALFPETLEYAIEVEWHCGLRKRTDLLQPGAASVKRTWDETIARLRNGGAEINNPKLLAKWVIERSSSIRGRGATVYVVTKPGWVELPDERRREVFVLPHDPPEGIIYRGENTRIGCGGDVTEWQERVARPSIEAWPLALAIMASMSSALIRPVRHHQPAGIHFWGDSSVGKTTALRAAASVWGADSMIGTWRSTVNGLEAAAEARNDLPLLLDEIGETTPEALAIGVYMIADGTGKTRAQRTGAAAPPRRWRCGLISTGERPVTSILGDTYRMGQGARLLDVHVRKNVIRNPSEISLAASEHYGHAGALFVSVVGSMKEQWPRLELRWKELYSRILQRAESRAAGDQKSGRQLTLVEARGMATIARAMLAGEIAIEHGILPWEMRELEIAIEMAVDEIVSGMSTECGRPGDEDSQIRDEVLSWIDRNTALFWDVEAGAAPPRECKGWVSRGDKTVYMVTPTTLKDEIGLPAHRVAEAIKDMLSSRCRAGDTPQSVVVRVPSGGTRRVYEIVLP